ncbi:MAG: M6 family metalloprotease domain-containing protein, partial [Duncaniella sp.]|nr:M6 family metalloprotease domain-containing protein [Duncaniella sp.]
FNRMLNEPGFSDYGATGSAVDYFIESSGGIFRPEFDVFGPVTLPNKMSYYGGNLTLMGGDKNAEAMIIEACQLLDDTVDFSPYDRDGDGFIDNVFVIYAGYGEASSGIADTVWPHSWDITKATTTPYIFDNVQLNRYACSNEWMDGRPDGVGTFVHEFSHVMGLPDLYATSYNESFTPGTWSCIDRGSYNNVGMTPPLYSAFERYALGWIEPVEINGPMDVTLPAIGANQCAIVKTDNPNEYFLFENRQQTSWDTYIPGHGMIVWHVDFDGPVWTSNVVNNTPDHQYVDLIEADGTQNELTRQSDVFPGTGGITSFTSTTTPAFKTWNGTLIDLPITNIAENNGVITFKVAGGRTDNFTAPVAVAATNVTPTSFVANWNAVEGAPGYVVTLRSTGEEMVTVIENFNVGTSTSFTFEGLKPGTTYEYEVATGYPIDHSAASNVVAVETSAATLDMLTAVALDPTDITENSFTANWEAVAGANAYIVDLFEAVPSELNESVCDFTQGVANMPEGWYTNAKEEYTQAAYCGEAVPAILFGGPNDIFGTLSFAKPIRGISFWQRGAMASDPADAINVSVKVGLKWMEIASFPVVTKSGGMTCVCENIPAGATQVKFNYVRKSMKGTVGIDDIRISWGKDPEKVAVANYPVKTSDVQTLAVSNLKPATTYIYNVTATDGTLQSIKSADAMVTTAEEQSGIVDTLVPAHDFYTLNGRTIEALDAISVYDIAGHCVANLAAGQQATLASGVYIVKAGDSVVKILI